MRDYFVTKNVGIFLFAFYFAITHCQCCSIWSHRNRNSVPPSSGNPSIKNHAKNPQQPYGPQILGDCRLKSSILDKRAIEATREAIRQCTDLPHSCSHSENNKFRTIDGSCNNLKHPSWGKSKNCLRRILPFDYSDGISHPRMSCTGKQLPNPRLISNLYHKQLKKTVTKWTTHFMEWGQMIAHDMSLNDIYKVPGTGGNVPIRCCTHGPVINDKCYSIPVPPNDEYYGPKNQTCIGYPRTPPCPLCKGGQRVHYNQNTAFIDLSLVYSSSEKKAKHLRSGKKGMLAEDPKSEAGPTPFCVKREELCISPPGEKACYKTGDRRSNQNPYLLTVHIYLFRHHNFLCQELHKINPHWNDERLYQEARRINIAIVQYITYDYYIPISLGEIVKKEGVQILPGAQYTNYDPELDPSLDDEYSAVTGRYGHTLIPGYISQIDPNTDDKYTLLLRNYFYTPFGFRYGMFDRTAKGMTIDRTKKRDTHLVDDVRNFLLRSVYLNISTGLDLAAASIVRGRDHGIPSYTHYLAYFLNLTINSFEDLKQVMSSKNAKILESLYESVHDLDFYSSGFAEFPVPGGFLGPTFAAVQGQLYKKLKFGDRYWFEHKDQAGSYTPDQLVEIKKQTVARILCETTKLTKVQRNVFHPPSNKNPVVSCEQIHKLNFKLWKE